MKTGPIKPNLSMYMCVDFSSWADDSNGMSVGAVLRLLPSEVICHIFSFLEAEFLLHSVRLVCKRFCHILTDVEFWRARLRERWQRKYPPVAGEILPVLRV